MASSARSDIEDVTEMCRYCGATLNLIRIEEEWDWSALHGSSLCASTNSPSGRHHPVNPVEGIDY